jgi:hypothetical protein
MEHRVRYQGSGAANGKKSEVGGQKSEGRKQLAACSGQCRYTLLVICYSRICFYELF